MRLARRCIPIALLAAGLLAGCGSSDSTDEESEANPARAPAGASAQSCPLDAGGIQQLRVTGLGCGAGQKIAIEWKGAPGCAVPAAASRSGCSVHGYRCLATTAERGTAVSCARSQRSIAFIAESG